MEAFVAIAAEKRALSMHACIAIVAGQQTVKRHQSSNNLSDNKFPTYTRATYPFCTPGRKRIARGVRRACCCVVRNIYVFVRNGS